MPLQPRRLPDYFPQNVRKQMYLIVPRNMVIPFPRVNLYLVTCGGGKLGLFFKIL